MTESEERQCNGTYKGLRTTVIGSYPKPDYLQTPNWFQKGPGDYSPASLNKFMENLDNTEYQKNVSKATSEVLQEQTDLGISIITDGEIQRENYIFHFCRKLKNFSFEDDKLTLKSHRNGAVTSLLPTVTGKLAPLSDKPWCVEEWKKTQQLTSTPVKITIPGPMTIINTSANSFYENDKELSLDLVKCINNEILALSVAGCKYIQVDEPVLVRNPEVALDYGIDHLKMCFEGVSPSVEKTIHLCCGYPNYLDDDSYMKADRGVYMKLSSKLDDAGFDAISIEDAHQHNDLSLLEKFKKTTVIFGVVAIAKSRVESVEEICSRVTEALKHISRDRLMLAPDCGLGYLPRSILKQKLENMVKAAQTL